MARAVAAGIGLPAGFRRWIWLFGILAANHFLDLMVTWRGGLAEMRATQSAIGMGLDMLADQGLDLTQNQASAEPIFDQYSTSIIGAMAVLKDVLLRIESGPMTDMAAQFIEVAAQKL